MLLTFSIMRVHILCTQGSGKCHCEAEVCVVATMATVIKKINLVALIFSFTSVNIKQGETC